MIRKITDRRLCVNRNAGNGICMNCGQKNVKFPYKRCYQCHIRNREEEKKEHDKIEKQNAQIRRSDGEGVLWKFQRR